MATFSTYYVSNETDNSFELREKKGKKILIASVLIPIGITFLILPIIPKENCSIPVAGTNNTYLIYIFFMTIAFVFISLAIYPFIFKGYLKINKQKKIICLLRGIRRLFGKPMIIPFSEIDHLKIESHDGYRGGPDFDRIILKRKNKSKIQLDISFCDFYTNEISSKLSKYLDCQVFQEGIGARQHLPGMGPFK